jgi:hypothetical protein
MLKAPYHDCKYYKTKAMFPLAKDNAIMLVTATRDSLALATLGSMT